MRAHIVTFEFDEQTMSFVTRT